MIQSSLRGGRIAVRVAARAVIALSILGCSGRRGIDVLDEAHQALTATALRVLGFEQASDWSVSSGAKANSTQHSEGQQSLALSQIGYAEIRSVPLTSLGLVSDNVSVDLLLPTAQPNPWWFGTIALKIDLPSQDLFSSWIGQQDLTGLPVDTFHRFSFALPAAVRDKLRGTYTDLTITIILNVPPGSGTYLLDRFDAGASTGGSSPVASGCVPGGRCLLLVRLPRGLSEQDARFVADNGMRLADRTHVVDETGKPGTIANDGGEINLGVEAGTGDVYSLGPLTLRDRAHVDGTVRSQGPISLASGAVINGETVDNPELRPLATKTWFISLPATFEAGRDIQPDQSDSLDPGAYGDVVVKSRATLNLKSGTYYLKSLDLEPQATVRLSASGDPTFIYVMSSLIHRGAFVSADGSPTNVFVGYVGTAPVVLEAPFRGTMVAPFATLTLSSIAPATYSGSFFAQQLETQPDAKVTLLPSLLPAIVNHDLKDCASKIHLDPTLPEPQRTRQENLDLLRFCLAPGIGDCEAGMTATANADRRALALQFLSKVIDAPDHMAMTRDISRKVHRMWRDPDRLAAYCQGDADGDRVPDSVDQCPGTPLYTPTDDSGCPISERPKTAPRGVVDGLLTRMGIFYNPKCNDAPPPRIPILIHCVYEAFEPGKGGAIEFSPITAAPSGCEVWYEAHIFVPRTQRTYYLAFERSQAASRVSDPIVFFSVNTDPDDRGAFANEVVIPGRSDTSRDGLRHIVVTARATNGNGVQSGWSGPVPMVCL